jgi:hypothetical protein
MPTHPNHPDIDPDERRLLFRISLSGQVTVSDAHRDPVVARLAAAGLVYGAQLPNKQTALKLTPSGVKLVARLDD